jgi:hypothetical protein
MLVEIKNGWTGSVIFAVEAENWCFAVEAAVKAKVSLYGASLDGASLNHASLNGASLNHASLNHASLNGANLYGANLNGANLYGANLDGASLYGANLYGANLDGASLNHANLNHASLNHANLNHASLNGANLYGANLDGANLYSANLNGVKGLPDTLRIETGEMWKDYLEQTVPALLAAGGHPVSAEAWQCHSRGNCPMSQAFEVKRLEDIPILHQPRVKQFVRYFDAKLILPPTTPVSP